MILRQPYRKHQVSVTSLVSPNFLSQIKTRYQDDQKTYVFKPVRKMIVRPGDRSYKSKSTAPGTTSGYNTNSRSVNGQLYAFAGGASIFEDSLMMADPLTSPSMHLNPFGSLKQMKINTSRDPVRF